MTPSKYRIDSEEYKEIWRVYLYIISRLYPSKHQVEAMFRALAEAGILADSYTTADVNKALEPYDKVAGLMITYSVKYGFLEYNFKGLAPKFAAVRKAGGPGHDVEATMLFNKDPEAIHDRFDKLDSGDVRFVIMAIDVGRADDAAWGSKYYANGYEIKKILPLEDMGWFFLQKDIEAVLDAWVEILIF